MFLFCEHLLYRYIFYFVPPPWPKLQELILSVGIVILLEMPPPMSMCFPWRCVQDFTRKLNLKLMYVDVPVCVCLRGYQHEVSRQMKHLP